MSQKSSSVPVLKSDVVISIRYPFVFIGAFKLIHLVTSVSPLNQGGGKMGEEKESRLNAITIDYGLTVRLCGGNNERKVHRHIQEEVKKVCHRL